MNIKKINLMSRKKSQNLSDKQPLALTIYLIFYFYLKKIKVHDTNFKNVKIYPSTHNQV